VGSENINSAAVAIKTAMQQAIKRLKNKKQTLLLTTNKYKR
jgi:hypothetical protein